MKSIKIILLSFSLAASLAVTSYAMSKNKTTIVSNYNLRNRSKNDQSNLEQIQHNENKTAIVSRYNFRERPKNVQYSESENKISTSYKNNNDVEIDTSKGNMEIDTSEEKNIHTKEITTQDACENLTSRYNKLWNSEPERKRRQYILKSLEEFDTLYSNRNINQQTFTTEQFNLLQSILLDYYNFSVLFDTKYSSFIALITKNINNSPIKEIKACNLFRNRYDYFLGNLAYYVKILNDFCSKILFNHNFNITIQNAYNNSINSENYESDAVLNQEILKQLSSFKTNLQNIFKDTQTEITPSSPLWGKTFKQDKFANNNFVDENSSVEDLEVTPKEYIDYKIPIDLKSKIAPHHKINNYILATVYKMELLKSKCYMNKLKDNPLKTKGKKNVFESYDKTKTYANNIFKLYNSLRCFIMLDKNLSSMKSKHNQDNIITTQASEVFPRNTDTFNNVLKQYTSNIFNNFDDIINFLIANIGQGIGTKIRTETIDEFIYKKDLMTKYKINSIPDLYLHVFENHSAYNNLVNISEIKNLNTFYSKIDENCLNNLNKNKTTIIITNDNWENNEKKMQYSKNKIPNSTINKKNKNFLNISYKDKFFIPPVKNKVLIFPKYDFTEMYTNKIKKKPIPEMLNTYKYNKYEYISSFFLNFWISTLEQTRMNNIKNNLKNFKELLLVKDKNIKTENISNISNLDLNLLQSILLDYYNFSVLFNEKYSPFIALTKKYNSNAKIEKPKEYNILCNKYIYLLRKISPYVEILNDFCSKILFDYDFNIAIQNAYAKNINTKSIEDEELEELNKKTLQKLLELKEDLQGIFKSTQTNIIPNSPLWANTFKNDQIANNNFINEKTSIRNFEVSPTNYVDYEIPLNLINQIPPQYKINSYILAAAYKMELLKSICYMKKLKDNPLKNENTENIFKSYEATKTHANDIFKLYNSLRCLITLDKNLNSKNFENNKNNKNNINTTAASTVFLKDSHKFNTALQQYTSSNNFDNLDDIINFSILSSKQVTRTNARNDILDRFIFQKDLMTKYKIESIPDLFSHVLKNEKSYKDLVNISNMKDLKDFYSQLNEKNTDDLKSTNIKFFDNEQIKYKSLNDYISDGKNYAANVPVGKYNMFVIEGLLKYYNTIWALPEEQKQRDNIIKRLLEFDNIYNYFDNENKIKENISISNEKFNSLQSILLDYYNFLLFFSKYNYLIKLITVKTKKFINYDQIINITEYKKFTDNYNTFTSKIKKIVEKLKIFVNNLIMTKFKDPENIDDNISKSDLDKFYQTARKLLELEPNFQKIFEIMGIDKITDNKVLNDDTTLEDIDTIPSISNNKILLDLHSINAAPPHYRVNLDILATVLKMEIIKWLPYFKQMQNSTVLNSQEKEFNRNFTQNKTMMNYYINKLYRFYDRLKSYIVWSMNEKIFSSHDFFNYSNKTYKIKIPIISKIIGKKDNFIKKIQAYIKDDSQFYTTLYLPEKLDKNLVSKKQDTNLFKVYYCRRQICKDKTNERITSFAQHIKDKEDIYNALINNDPDISYMKILDEFFSKLDPDYFEILSKKDAITDNPFLMINNNLSLEENIDDKSLEENMDDKNLFSKQNSQNSFIYNNYFDYYNRNSIFKKNDNKYIHNINKNVKNFSLEKNESNYNNQNGPFSIFNDRVIFNSYIYNQSDDDNSLSEENKQPFEQNYFNDNFNVGKNDYNDQFYSNENYLESNLVPKTPPFDDIPHKVSNNQNDNVFQLKNLDNNKKISVKKPFKVIYVNDNLDQKTNKNNDKFKTFNANSNRPSNTNVSEPNINLNNDITINKYPKFYNENEYFTNPYFLSNDQDASIDYLTGEDYENLDNYDNYLLINNQSAVSSYLDFLIKINNNSNYNLLTQGNIQQVTQNNYSNQIFPHNENISIQENNNNNQNQNDDALMSEENEQQNDKDIFLNRKISRKKK